MITRGAFENWRFRLRLCFAFSIIAATAAAVIPAAQLHEKTLGWFGKFFYAQAMRDLGFGEAGKVPGMRLGPNKFLIVFCDKNPFHCDEFRQNYRKIVFVYPALAAGGVVLVFLLFPALGFFHRREDEKYRRGAQIVDAKVLRKQLKKEPATIHFGGVPYPRSAEVLHLLLAGATGTGKSVAIRTLLAAIRARGDRAIVVDVGGISVREFARQGDALLNPFDSRSQAWSPFAEAENEWEIDAVSRSLIPPAEGSEKVWADLAKAVLAGLMAQCRAHGMAQNRALAALATCADPAMLARVLAGHPAQGLVASGSPQTVGSILTTLGEKLAGLRYLQPDSGDDAFSVGRWVREGAGWIFLSFQLSQREALKHVLAAQLDCAVRAVLSLPPDPGRRIWLVVDELPLLGRVAGIEEFLTNGRKFGGAAVLGIQAVSQLRQTYGRDGAATFLSCLSSQLVLRQPDGETAELLSRALGDKEIQRTNQSRGKTEHGQSHNEAEQIANSRVVLASELQNLPDRTGFLNLVGDRPICRVELAVPPVRESGNPPFVPAPTAKPQPFVLPDRLRESAASVGERPRPAARDGNPANWRDFVRDE